MTWAASGARAAGLGPWAPGPERHSLSGPTRAAPGQIGVGGLGCSRHGSAQVCAQVSPTLTCCVTLGKWLPISQSPFLPGKSGKAESSREGHKRVTVHSTCSVRTGSTSARPQYCLCLKEGRALGKGVGEAGCTGHPGAGARGRLFLGGPETFSAWLGLLPIHSMAHPVTYMQIRPIPLRLPTALRMKSARWPGSRLCHPHSPSNIRPFACSLPCHPCSCLRAFAHAVPAVSTPFPRISAWLALLRSQLRGLFLRAPFQNPPTETAPWLPVYFIQSIVNHLISLSRCSFFNIVFPQENVGSTEQGHHLPWSWQHPPVH